jgi:hypothetical protein
MISVASSQPSFIGYFTILSALARTAAPGLSGTHQLPRHLLSAATSM